MNDALKVLLIEDNPGDARLIRETLLSEKAGLFHLESVDRLSAGLQKLSAQKIDVILLDLGLPDSQGFDTFLKVKILAPHIPVVILSGLNDEELAAHAVREGAQDYLVKGKVDNNLLVRSLRYAIERKLAEKERRLYDERFHLLVDSAPDTIYIQTGGNFIYINAAGLTLFGAQGTSQLLGQPVVQRFHPDYREQVLSRIKTLNDDHQSVPLVEERIVRFNGEAVDVEVSAVPFLYQNEHGGLVFVRDISERKQAQLKALQFETLTRLSQAKSDLLSNVSHELRTPLAAIKGNIESLIEPDVTWNKQQQLEFLTNANQQTDVLTVLIKELLDMSRIEAGRLILNKEVCAFDAILDEVNTRLKTICLNHKLQISISPKLPPLSVDKGRIGEVITNLVENATKFSPHHSLITIQTYVEDSNLLITVGDQGIGISADDIAKLFDRFYQAKASVSGKTKGTGLGLAICKGILDAHEGKIWVESQPGQGSNFIFSLPLAK
jgi:PAS domain S-box-containing protein